MTMFMKRIFLVVAIFFIKNCYSQIIYFCDSRGLLYSFNLSNCTYTQISNSPSFITIAQNSTSDIYSNDATLLQYKLNTDSISTSCDRIPYSIAMCFDNSDRLFLINDGSFTQFDYQNCTVVSDEPGINYDVDGDLEYYNNKFYFTSIGSIIEINETPPFNPRILYQPGRFTFSYGLTLTCYNNINSLITFETTDAFSTLVKQVNVLTGDSSTICTIPLIVYDAANYYVKPNFFSLGKDTAFCDSFSYILKTPLPANWSTGESGLASIEVQSPGIYWAEVSNGCGIYRDSINIRSEASNHFTIGKDTALCKPFEINLSSGYDSTLWSTGILSDKITVSDYGTYWATVKNKCVKVSDTITLSESDCSNCIPFIPIITNNNNIRFNFFDVFF